MFVHEAQEVSVHACYPDACSEWLIQSPESPDAEDPHVQKKSEDRGNQTKQTTPAQPVDNIKRQKESNVDQPTKETDKNPKLVEEEKPKDKNISAGKKIPQETVTPVKNLNNKPLLQTQQTNPNIDNYDRTPLQTSHAGKGPGPEVPEVVQQSEEKVEKLHSSGVKSSTSSIPQGSSERLPIDKAKLQDNQPSSKEKSTSKTTAETVVSKEASDVTNKSNEMSPQKTEPIKMNRNASADLINTKTIEEVKKNKSGDKPATQQLLDVPKGVESQVQDTDVHSTEEPGKDEKLLSTLPPADATKSFGNSKNSLKPVQVGCQTISNWIQNFTKF